MLDNWSWLCHFLLSFGYKQHLLSFPSFCSHSGYELLKICFQATSLETYGTYGYCLLVAFIFALVGAGQMAASHSTVLYQCLSFVASSITHFIITAVLFEQGSRVLKMHFLNNWYFGFLLLTGSLSKFPLPDKSELVSSCSTSSTSVFQNYAMEVQDDLIDGLGACVFKSEYCLYLWESSKLQTKMLKDGYFCHKVDLISNPALERSFSHIFWALKLHFSGVCYWMQLNWGI